MKKIVDLKIFAKNALAFTAYFFITFASRNYLPVSLALLVANLYLGFNPLVSGISCFIPYLFSLSEPIVLTALWGCAFISVSFYLFSRYGKKPKFLIFFAFLAVLPFMAVNKTYSLPMKIAVTAGIIPLPYLFLSAGKVWSIKGLKYKLSKDEVVSALALYCLVGYGVINVFGLSVWKQFAVFTVLLSTAVAPFGYGAFVAFSSAIPLAVFEVSFIPVAVFFIYFAVASLFSSYSRLLSAFFVLGTELLLYYLTDAFGQASAINALYIIIPVCLFVFIPESSFKKLKGKLKIYTSATVGRYAVNRNRTALSSKLYDLSSVFDEMADCIEKLGKRALTKEEKTRKLTEKVLAEGCYNCRGYKNCAEAGAFCEIEKVISIGTAKGKVNLVDIPEKVIDNCTKADKLVETMNSAIKEGERQEEELSLTLGGREIIKFQALGLSEALKGLALSYSKISDFNSETESKVRDSLIKCGIYPYEILAYDGETADIDLVVPSSALEKSYFLKAIDEAVGYKTAIVGRTNLSSSLSAVTVKKAPPFDAVFGISQRTKDGEKYSGDTHSIMKISESKFLVALNDGMGSGEEAMKVSSVATSLIESFYKSGLPSKIILSIVNKLLAFDKEDNFTAMDIGIVDLSDGSADFIKIGSPYSFIITKDSVKIIEGNSLPLGILDEIKPTALKTELKAGDMIVFISDGVADAFGSASEVIDFLSTQRALNPKTLASDIIDKASICSKGRALDDMTAFCVRIFN